MMKHLIVFDTPSPIREFVQAIQGVGAVDEISDIHTTIIVESETAYELGRTVVELEYELTTVVNDIVHIKGKPVLVED